MRTIQSEMERNKLAKDNEQPKPKPKKKEQFSRRELEQLMGIKRDTYRRVNGAVRRK